MKHEWFFLLKHLFLFVTCTIIAGYLTMFLKTDIVFTLTAIISGVCYVVMSILQHFVLERRWKD